MFVFFFFFCHIKCDKDPDHSQHVSHKEMILSAGRPPTQYPAVTIVIVIIITIIIIIIIRIITIIRECCLPEIYSGSARAAK